MMLPAALRLERQGQDHVGLEGAYALHHVAERLVVAPLLERLLDAERVAELVGEAEVLLDAVVAVECRQVLGAQDAERLEQLGTDRVLAALAARQRQQAGPDAAAAGKRDQHAVVLVVGMGGDVEDAAGDAQTPQRQPQADGSLVLGDGHELGLNDAEAAEKVGKEEDAERATQNADNTEESKDHDAPDCTFRSRKA